MRIKILTMVSICFCVIIFIWLSGCTDKYKPTANQFASLEKSSCTHCHLNAELLKDIANPIPDDNGESGEG